MSERNETVLITGAAAGIGFGTAVYYAENGCQVIGVDKDRERGRKAMENLPGERGVFYYCDVSDPQSTAELFKQLNEDNRSFSILINNAGESTFTSLFELSVEDWDRILNTNLRSVFLFSKLSAALWKKNGTKGRIVNMASTRALMSEPDSEAYAASKGGITALTHALASSLSPRSIRVNCISPGWIHTGQEELTEADHAQHLSNRVGHTTDVAKACFYLTDPDNDFVNGENLVIDGGMTRKMMYEE
ncbi:SDR family NAD(P)-dependent oxidoreductase [Halobacillus litoralis]|uniref:SDR family NAD(P)-dependent oxidoreductase n=1 Tax=Halobacillus litoralis TaxID=45668 RepID=UPI001CD2A1E5|nr:SDR family oxidoreductase [Halobacillus litoralis]MCA1023509.1 SDR family oxidoreductase [Halobacillus litoralis]